MKRIVATLLALLFATAANAQSGLLPANWVWAGPPSGGQGFARARALVAADLPALAPGGLSLASGQIMVGQVSGFAGAVAMSGDCTIVASGAITCTKTGGVALAALATTAPGAGVATALGTAVGSAGAVVVNGGVLGTPSSGVGTNLTALNASNLSSGTVAAARGGAGTITGALKGSGAGVVTQAACADLSNAAASCSTDATNAANIASGTLAVARGGTNYTGGAWTSYPAVLAPGAGSITTQLSSSSYLQIGKIVIFNLAITVSNVGTASGNPTVTLPNSTTFAHQFACSGREAGVSGKLLQGAGSTGSGSLTVFNYDNSTITWTNGIVITCSGVYEAQ